jgi:transposase
MARGIPRVDDRRVLNGIFWVLRSAARWRDLPETYGPASLATTASLRCEKCSNNRRR